MVTTCAVQAAIHPAVRGGDHRVESGKCAELMHPSIAVVIVGVLCAFGMLKDIHLVYHCHRRILHRRRHVAQGLLAVVHRHRDRYVACF